MKTKLLFASILLIFCISTKSNNVGKLPENGKEIKLFTNRSTFLFGARATRIIGDLKKQAGDNFEWKGNGEMDWTISVPKTEKYDLYLIADIPAESKNVEMVFSSGSISYKFTTNPTIGPWSGGGKNFQRIKVLSKLVLPEGNQEVGLKSTGLATGKAFLTIRSVELVPVSAYKSIEKENKKAVASRASTEWLVKAGYGLMFHYTSQSVNPDGSNRPYEKAVNDFDVKKFADMVEETGAGYVIFTIGHAQQYCPAPIKSWEKIHPGKTTQRDLIEEMANALNTKGIRLLLYMNSYGTAKFGKVDNLEFYTTFTDILKEFGDRYKEKVAGYWFDCWYQIFEGFPDIPIEDFFKVCKTGNKDRIICLNSWIYPSVSPWQEYWAGEVASPVALPVNGHMVEGPATDLRYQALLIMEPYWVQQRPDHPDPRFTATKLSQYIRECMDNKGVVTINMGIFQNGTVGGKALDVMKEVRKMVRGDKSSDGRSGK
jgi:hypothetical protein